MNYDYDLVIIGQRPAAIAAAELALTWGARVALVMSSDRLPETTFPGSLGSAGIDVVYASYQFVPRRAMPSKRQPQVTLDLQVVEPLRANQSRKLRSRKYLLAPDARSIVPDIPGLRQTRHVAIGDRSEVQDWFARFETRKPERRPRRAIVYGGQSLVGLELALMLVDRGLETHLIAPEPALLAGQWQADGSTSLMQLWQLQAIAKGLNCSLQSKILNVRSVEREIWLQTEDQQVIGDVLFVADRLVPKLDLDNLQTCGATLSHDRVWVDRHLCTTHPQIYACAAALGGHDAESIATHEAITATRNALAPWRSQSPNYRAIPWGVATPAGFACVGLNLSQAQAECKDATTIDLSLPDPGSRPASHWEEPVAAQIILNAAGEILGATIVGDRAADSIVPFSLAIGQGASIEAWKTWAGLESTAGAIAEQLYRIWRDRWWQSHPSWRSHVRSWFDDRRG